MEIVILFILLFWVFCGIDDGTERIKSTVSIISSFIAVLLTTSLVYYNFFQMPELAFTGFLVEPLVNADGYINSCAIEKNIEQVAGNRQVRNDIFSRKFPTWIKIVQCNDSPTFLRVRNDVTNLGLYNAKIHEIRYYMTYPNKKLLYTLPKRISLEHQERETISWEIGHLDSGGYLLKAGIFRLKFEVIGATVKYSKQVWVRISGDLKTIEWSESRFKILTRF